MGFLEKAFKKAINKKIKQHKSTAKSRHTSSYNKESDVFGELRKKQELADKMRTAAKLESQGRLKIIQDCVSLVNTTVNPEVFFMRYNLMLEHLEALAGLECTGIYDNSPELPSEAFLRVEAQFDDATISFLDRSFENAKNRADTLKTDTGKKNAIKRYFDNMEKHIIQMNDKGLEHLDKMKEENGIHI